MSSRMINLLTAQLESETNRSATAALSSRWSIERIYSYLSKEPALRTLCQKKLEQLNERTKRGDYVSAEAYATAYARMGDKEQALAWVGRAVQERNGFWFYVKDNPIFDSLRDDPRFQDLLRGVEFKQ